jgi:hypothetical protein
MIHIYNQNSDCRMVSIKISIAGYNDKYFLQNLLIQIVFLTAIKDIINNIAEL